MNFTINELDEKNNNFENRGIVKIRLEAYPMAEDVPYTYLKINIETKEVLKTREGGMPASDGRSLYKELGKRMLSNEELIELKELLIEIRDNNEYTNFQEPNHLDNIRMYNQAEMDALDLTLYRQSDTVAVHMPVVAIRDCFLTQNSQNLITHLIGVPRRIV